MAEAVAVGLDEEATLYGRGAENYGDGRGYSGLRATAASGAGQLRRA